MRWLEDGQTAMMLALDRGPAHLSQGVFRGPAERILAGMKIHANTISHARLVAMEETYPRTRAGLGHAAFLESARLFLEQPGVAGRSLARIGEGFDRFLARENVPAAHCALARFEWLWLEAYHAAEAEPLTLDTLTVLPPQSLLAFSIVRHPSAFAGRFDPQVHALLGTEIAGLTGAEAILIARPEAEVLIHPASSLMIAIMDAATRPITIGDLIGSLLEPAGASADSVPGIMQELAGLVRAGAIMKA